VAFGILDPRAILFSPNVLVPALGGPLSRGTIVLWYLLWVLYPRGLWCLLTILKQLVGYVSFFTRPWVGFRNVFKSLQTLLWWVKLRVKMWKMTNSSFFLAFSLREMKVRNNWCGWGEKKKNRRFIYSLARSFTLASFASLNPCLFGAGKEVGSRQATTFQEGQVASLVNPIVCWTMIPPFMPFPPMFAKNRFVERWQNFMGKLSGWTHQEKKGKNLPTAGKESMFRARIHLHDRRKKPKMSKMLNNIILGRSGYWQVSEEKVSRRTKRNVVAVLWASARARMRFNLAWRGLLSTCLPQRSHRPLSTVDNRTLTFRRSMLRHMVACACHPPGPKS